MWWTVCLKNKETNETFYFSDDIFEWYKDNELFTVEFITRDKEEYIEMLKEEGFVIVE